MKAIRYLGPRLCGIEDLPIPQAPDGFALVRISHAGICGTDLNIYAGTHPRAKAPLTMGHEFSGTVAKDGALYKAGTRVTAYPLISCGHCEACKSGNGHVCRSLGLYGIDRDGGMAEYVILPEDLLIPLPDDVSFRLGAFIEPVAVTVHTLRERGFRAGDSAIVFGCGTIGLCLALTLRRFGAGTLLLAETDPFRRSLAESMGFAVIDPVEADVIREVMRLTDDNGFDFVFDCAGVSPVAALLFDAVKVKGKIVIVASYKKPPEMPLFKGMVKETEIDFVRVYRKNDFAIAANLVRSEPLYDRIITHVLPADEAQKGFDLLLAPGTGAVKVMFCFDEKGRTTNTGYTG